MSEASASAELLRALAALAEPPAPESARLALALDLGEPPTGAEYADVLVFQLYPYASVHVGPEGMLGGEARERVAGVWRALGHTPPPEPDHLAALLGLYASLAQRARDAGGAPAVLAEESRTALLHEHVAPWAFSFLARCCELATGFYARWASLLAVVLEGEVRRSSGWRERDLPVHLRLAPALGDPRESDAKAFVPTLLAPVCSGVILTRADLARIAAANDLGLRAGERRYALEHLLGQAPSVVLSALADEARRQCTLHAERADWLGPIGAFHAERARRSARLLESLAADGASPSAEARAAGAR